MSEEVLKSAVASVHSVPDLEPSYPLEDATEDAEDEGLESDASDVPVSPLDPRALRMPTSQKRRELNPYIDRVTTLPELIVPMSDALARRGRWQSTFQKAAPLYVELGSGYGHFLAELAPCYPDRNFVGIELKFKRLYKSAEKILKQDLHNVQYLRFNVLMLEHTFAPGEVSGAYINFPDPWPKNGQIQKRMVSPLLVAQLERILPPGGVVQLKSDWEPNREWFRESFEGSRFEMTDYITDLGEWNRAEKNIQTSYERRFRRQGLPCFFYEFTLRGV